MHEIPLKCNPTNQPDERERDIFAVSAACLWIQRKMLFSILALLVYVEFSCRSLAGRAWSSHSPCVFVVYLWGAWSLLSSSPLFVRTVYNIHTVQHMCQPIRNVVDFSALLNSQTYPLHTYDTATRIERCVRYSARIHLGIQQLKVSNPACGNCVQSWAPAFPRRSP